MILIKSLLIELFNDKVESISLIIYYLNIHLSNSIFHNQSVFNRNSNAFLPLYIKTISNLQQVIYLTPIVSLSIGNPSQQFSFLINTSLSYIILPSEIMKNTFEHTFISSQSSTYLQKSIFNTLTYH